MTCLPLTGMFWISYWTEFVQEDWAKSLAHLLNRSSWRSGRHRRFPPSWSSRRGVHSFTSSSTSSCSVHPSTSLGPSFRGTFAPGVPFYSVLLGDRVPVAFNVLVQGGVRVSIGLLERNVVQAKFLGRFSYLEFVLSFEQTKRRSEQSKAWSFGLCMSWYNAKCHNLSQRSKSWRWIVEEGKNGTCAS